MDTNNRFDLIREWANERGIYDQGDVKTQFVKLGEEYGELAKAIIDEDKEGLEDAIGDMGVVLTNLAYLAGFSFEGCIDTAYDVIKNRKGKMQNGSFIKDDGKQIEFKPEFGLGNPTGRVYKCIDKGVWPDAFIVGFEYKEIQGEFSGDHDEAEVVYLEGEDNIRYYVDSKHFQLVANKEGILVGDNVCINEAEETNRWVETHQEFVKCIGTQEIKMQHWCGQFQINNIYTVANEEDIKEHDLSDLEDVIYVWSGPGIFGVDASQFIKV